MIHKIVPVLFVGLASVPGLAFAAQEPPIIAAIDQGSVASVRRLIAIGEDPNVRSENGEPALVYVLHKETVDLGMVETLLAAKKLDIDAESARHQTALMVAAYRGNVEIVEKMLTAGAEVNHTGWTALHFAAMSGNPDVVEMLLKHSAYVDAPSPNHTTPLMMAARVGDADVCRILMDDGADPTLSNDVGKTAAQFASERAGNAELAAVLGKAAATFRSAHPLPIVPAPRQ